MQADLELRAAIDTETVRGPAADKRGLAAGLVTMLPTIVKDPNLRNFGSLMIIGRHVRGRGTSCSGYPQSTTPEMFAGIFKGSQP